jgi:transcriptional regulator with XRE-family HTH domain
MGMPKLRTAFYTARKKARNGAGMTQQELERLSGVRQSIISDLETGKNTNPSWDVLSKIAQVLGVRVEQLIKKAPLPKRGTARRPIYIGAPLHEATL